MKLLNEKLSLLVILALTLVISSCSDTADVEDLNESETNLTKTAEVVNTRAGRAFQDCINYSIPPGPSSAWVIEYAPNLTNAEKEVIRLDYPGVIYCISYNYDPSNPDTELWQVSGYASAKPKAETPDDPDIETAIAQ